jgi:glycosyltransferase involved in cell wall biosynthesis
MRNKNKVTISLVTLTYNEEKRIGKFLESAKNLVDEMIVVDDESTDSSVKIARQYGAKVIIKKKDTEATQWRYALSLAKGDWILWGGADQWLSEDLAEDIKKRVGKEKYTGYNVTMQELFLGKPLRVKNLPFYKGLWVVKRNKIHLPKVLVHQYVTVSGSIGQLNGVMYHDTFRSFDQIISKFNYYTTLQAKEAFAKGQRTNFFTIFIAPVYTFFWRQIKLSEYKDGFLGIFLSMCFGLDRLFFYLKLWELQFRSDGLKNKL